MDTSTAATKDTLTAQNDRQSATVIELVRHDRLTVEAVAFQTGLSARTIRRYCTRGTLKADKAVGGDWLIEAASLANLQRPARPTSSSEPTATAGQIDRLTGQLTALAQRCGYLEGQLQERTLRLSDGEGEKARLAAERDEATARLTDARRRVALISSIAARVIFGRS